MSSKGVPVDLNTIFISKFNNTNLIILIVSHCLHCGILKTFYGIKEKRAHKGFKVFKIRF